MLEYSTRGESTIWVWDRSRGYKELHAINSYIVLEENAEVVLESKRNGVATW